MLGIYNSNFAFKLWLLRFEYIGMAGAVYFWVFFIARYTQLDTWLNKWVFFVLFIIPLFTIICVFRSPFDTVIRSSYEVEKIKGVYVFVKNYAWGFFLWTGYAYTMILAGLVMLTIRIAQVSGSTRTQLVFLVPIVFLVIVPNVTFITDNNLIEPYDPTPITLVLVGILFVLSIYFYKFLDVVPVAHSLILKNVKSGVVIIDTRLHIIEVNRVAEAIINKSEGQVLGKSIFKIIPELEELLHTTTADQEIKAELTLGADQKSYELSINPLTDDSENKFGQVIMLWDISEQKMALNELDSYARTVAHDLKNPLSHIIGFAKLIADGDSNDEDRDEHLQNIITSGDKMKNIIDGLLMLAKIRNIDKMDMTPMDMGKVIESVHQRLFDSLEDRSAAFLLPAKWHEALGNPLWIEEVWMNLITNALKYGGSPPKIELGSEINGKFIKFWIKDNGNGLSDEEKAYLFTEFTRLHPKRSKIKGYGLGLSIVERIVRKLNGQVGVSSTPGQGSTFYFKLPIV